MQQLISAALRRARPGITCELADSAEQALRTAVALAAGAPTLFLYEKLATAQAALAAIGAAALARRRGPARPRRRHAAGTTLPDTPLPETTLPDLALPDLAAAFSDASADYEPVKDAGTPPALAVE